jgi:inhibitor of cysteine peptidase
MERKPFSLLTAGLVLSFAILGCSASARAALCSKCRELMFVDSVGKCSDCGGTTASGALQLCPKCSLKRRQCEHCLARLTDQDLAAAGNGNDAADRPTRSETPSAGPGADSSSPKAAEKESSGWTAPSNSDPANGSPDAANNPGSTGNPVKPEEPVPARASGPEIDPLPPSAPNSEKSAGVPALAGNAMQSPALPAVPQAGQPPAELPLEAAAPAKLKPINPVKPGTYTAGKWRYQLQIVVPGTRSEGRWGWLTYNGQKLPRGDVNDYYDTPWGPIYWVDVPTTAWGLHGWMPVPLAQNRRQGRALALAPAWLASAGTQAASSPTLMPAPNPAQLQKLEINKSHNGQLARLRVGNVLVLRLPGNPATGYQWQLSATNSPAVRLTVRPQYSPSPANTSTAAAAGTYTFTFQAVQPGSGTLKLYYVRPNDPSRPRDTFAVGVNVSPEAPARPANPLAGRINERQ